MNNLYKILKVKQKMTCDEIKNQCKVNKESCNIYLDAYRILTTEHLRQQYDSSLKNVVMHPTVVWDINEQATDTVRVEVSDGFYRIKFN